LKHDQNKDGDKTGLDIIKLVVNDQRFDDKIFQKGEGIAADKLLKEGGDQLIAEYTQMWKCDVDDLRRTGVLVNTAVIRPKKAPHLDFFLMHATTSCLFLDIFVHSFKKKENQTKFLRAKFAVDLIFYVARGRPKLNLDYLIDTFQPSKEHSYLNAQNPWLPLIDKTLTHPDEHVPKTIRSLIYAEKLDGAREKDKLPYLKIAQMVMDALFPADKKEWVLEGIGSDEYWETVQDL
jgi:hypothetical protein